MGWQDVDWISLALDKNHGKTRLIASEKRRGDCPVMESNVVVGKSARW